MSYILDALKKAEQTRHPRVVPTVDTVHAPPPPTPRRRWWPWALGCVGLANAAVLVFFLYPTPTTAPLIAERARPAPPMDSSPAGSGERAESAPAVDASKTGAPAPVAESHRTAAVTPPAAQTPVSSSRPTALSPAIAPTPRARAAAPPAPTPAPAGAIASRTDPGATR